eukprot:m.577126 g.577126  ORF g.577126 m.577126 type:complete len:351 (-) comp22292_c0_seq19:1440-2492(-)
MSASGSGKTVAVTGASGFLGSYVTKSLLARGYTVRATVRDPTNAAKTEHLKKLADGASGTLELCKADLMTNGSFDSIFVGCDAVIHCAAVVSNANQVKDPMKDIVEVSTKGSANVISSIIKAKTVKKVIHTSSVAAIQTYDKPADYVFSEKDWNDWSSETNKDYYGIAKVEAEKIMKEASEAHGFELVCINPGVVFGPCMTKAHTKASPCFVRELIYGNPLGDISFTFVDAREVGEAHVNALEKDGINGERFIITGDHDTHYTRMPQVADTLSQLFPSMTFKANLYSGFLYTLAWYFTMSTFEKAVITSEIHLDNSKSKNVLGIKYRPASETLKDTVSSMVDTGFVKVKK